MKNARAMAHLADMALRPHTDNFDCFLKQVRVARVYTPHPFEPQPVSKNRFVHPFDLKNARAVPIVAVSFCSPLCACAVQMSHKMTTSNKSAAAVKAANAAAAAQQRFENKKAGSAAVPSNDLLNNPMYFMNIPPESVRVWVGAKDNKINVAFDGAGTARTSGNQARNTSSPYLPAMLVGAGSRMAGEGNVGVIYDEAKRAAYTRKGCTYNLTLRVGTTASGQGGDALQKRQEAALKWIFDVECAIMGKIFDLNLPEWVDPIQEARANACRELWRELKDAKGEPLADQLALQKLIASTSATGKAAAKQVEELARKLFVEVTYKQKKKGVQCAPIYDEDGRTVQGYMQLYAHRKCYGFIEGKWETSAFREDHGPSLQVLASTRENWSKILQEMKAIDRVYQVACKPLFRGQALRTPTITVYEETIHPVTAERTLSAVKVRDPFWNPLLESEKGVKLDTLALCQITFRVKRGKSKDDYGVKVDYKPDIHISVQEKRPINELNYTADYQEGLFHDDSDDEGEAPVTVFGAQTTDQADDPLPFEQQATTDAPEEGQVDDQDNRHTVPSLAVPEPSVVDEDAPDPGVEGDNEVAADAERAAEAEQDAEPEQDADPEQDGEPDEDDGEAERLAAEAAEAARAAAEEAARAAKAKAAGKRKGAPGATVDAKRK